MSRPSWDDYFIQQCELIATRSTCDRKHVGAVIVRDKRIIASGYNGSLPGQDHCDNVGHMMEAGHCVRVSHAEANAIAQAAKFGISTEGATLYCNTLPCWTCLKLIISAGITDIYYRDTYRPEIFEKLNSGLYSLVRIHQLPG